MARVISAQVIYPQPFGDGTVSLFVGQTVYVVQLALDPPNSVPLCGAGSGPLDTIFDHWVPLGNEEG